MAARPAFKAQLTGDKEMKAHLMHFANPDKGIRKEAREALKTVGASKLEIAVGRAPERTGRLKRSGRLLVMVSPKKQDLRIALVFGGDGLLYARKVHDTHPTHSGYLLSVLLEAAGTIGREIATHIDMRRAAAA